MSRPLLLLLLCALASLYLSLFRLPFTLLFGSPDQWAALLNASRMWEGERIYRDYFELRPPGNELVHLLFFRLFGLHNWIPNVHVVLLGLGLTWLVDTISRKVIRVGRFWSLLPAFLFLTVAFFPHMGDTHRWYNSVAVMAALAVVLEGRTPRRLVVAGVLSGVASFFTQTQGVAVVVGLEIFLLWEWRRKGSRRQELLQQTICLLVPFTATVLGTNAYFIWKAGVDRFLECIVRFPVLYYPADRDHASWHVYMTGMPELTHWYRLPRLGGFLFIHAVVPLVYILFLFRYRRETASGEQGVRLMLLNIIGLSLFASVAPAPSFLRLCTVSPPALIILVHWISGGGKLCRIAAGLLWTAVFGFGVAHPLRVQTSAVSSLQLSRGRMAFSEPASETYQLFRWLSPRTRPGEFFLAGMHFELFFPLALRDPAEVSDFDNTDFTRPEQVQNAVAALERHRVRFIQWPPSIRSAGLQHPEEDHLDPLRAYLREHYHLAKRFDSATEDEVEEIWERNE
jgi:hypothetical protein